MYIEPNTQIVLLHDVNIDNTYENTLYFDTIEEQTTYFLDKAIRQVGILTPNTYQRKERGYIRVGVPISRCFDCDYIMYKNSNFENKWIYAFVTSVNYINNEVTEIQYEIDSIQTWLFEIQWQDVMVLREHVNNDTVGLHVLPEPINIGEYFVCVDQKEFSQDQTVDFTQWVVMVISSYNSNLDGDNPVGGEVVAGCYTGCTMFPIPYTGSDINVTKINDYLGDMVRDNKVESIVSIVMMPKCIINQSVIDSFSGGASSGSWAEQREPISPTHAIPITPPSPDNHETSETSGYPLNTIDGYQPLNNKLFTFPYNYLYVINSQGEGHEYRWEAFSDVDARNRPSFKMLSSVSATPELLLVPVWYKGQHYNYDELIPMSNFPMLAFSYDSFKAWVASGGLAKTVISMAGHAVGIGTGAFEGISGAGIGNYRMQAQGAGAVGGGLVGLVNDVADIAIEARKPNILKGNWQANTMVSNRVLGYYCMSMQIRQADAIRADKFFTRYGYAVNTIKRPPQHNRRYYTYCQTQNCDIGGSLPVSDKDVICAALDRGVTWWTKDATIGDYRVNPVYNG